MKDKILLREYNEAGTDFPYFEDEKTGKCYEATWNGDYGFPFGYWPCDSYGTEMFCVGEPYSTHGNTCGIAAERYVEDMIYDNLKDNASYLTDALDELVNDMKKYGYTYNEDTDTYISADGSDEFDIDDKVRDIMDNSYNMSYDYIRECVENAIENGTYPESDEIVEYLMDNYVDDFNFSDQRSIDDALQQIGTNFYDFFELGRNEGRIWPHNQMISFYTTEQPDPNTLTEIMRDLSNSDIGVSYEALLDYVMVFEDWRNDGEVTACTISDFIDGNYGPEYEDEEDDDDEVQYARQGKTQFIPHLANPEEKRSFFKGFRDTRDKAVYVPREKGAGNLARYHALRYPYGENKEIIGKILREEINKLW